MWSAVLISCRHTPQTDPQNVGAPVRGARTPRHQKRLRINRNHPQTSLRGFDSEGRAARTAAPTSVCTNVQCHTFTTPQTDPHNVGAPVRGARTPRQQKRLRINRNHPQTPLRGFVAEGRAARTAAPTFFSGQSALCQQQILTIAFFTLTLSAEGGDGGGWVPLNYAVKHCPELLHYS